MAAGLKRMLDARHTRRIRRSAWRRKKRTTRSGDSGSPKRAHRGDLSLLFHGLTAARPRADAKQAENLQRRLQ